MKRIDNDCIALTVFPQRGGDGSRSRDFRAERTVGKVHEHSQDSPCVSLWDRIMPVSS